ncbi:MAG: terminase large subunit [Oscillospiraceae bacterium]|jgi:phage terminase large subunit-like protein|nr:terminase large subunit [Oscillospiraceae bacterium]
MDDAHRLKNYKPTPFKAPGSVYKERFADSAVYFCQHLKHTKGKWHGVPFELLNWQEQIVRDLFGIVRKYDECRQFRRAYIELPKKNGKSELAAAIALLLTCTDLEHGGEVYGCATDRQQASIVFDVALQMVEQFSGLKKYITFNSHLKRLTFKPLNSFYQVLSAEAFSKDGINAHGIIFDELHAQRSRELFDVVTSGSGLAREQPLTFIITTAGFDRNSICWEQHQKAEGVLRGTIIDPTFDPVIYSAADDDDWTDPEVWRRVNPSFGVTIDPSGFRAEFEDAKLNPSNENKFRRLSLNQWVRQTTRWMPMETWDHCAFDVDLGRLKGRKCYGGLDLSSTEDMTAFVLVFPPEDDDDKYIILPFFWVPDETLHKRVAKDHVPYDQWVARGLLEATDGAVINYNFVRKKIEELSDIYEIQEIAFDRWGASLIRQNLEDVGFKMIRFGQGYDSMSPASKELMRLVLQRRVAHGGHPILRWNFDNIVVRQDETGNIKPNKSKITERIDGAIATIMALDRATRLETRGSVYDKRGLLIIDPCHPNGYYYSD